MAAQRKPSFLSRVEALPIIVVFVLLLLFFMWQAPSAFLAPNMYTTFLTTLPPLVLLAVGLTFVIGAGEIDLSFPSIIAFSGAVFALLFTAQDFNFLAFDFEIFGQHLAWSGIPLAWDDFELSWLALIVAILSGTLVGWLNGILVARVGIPSFIATLGTQFFWAGCAAVLAGGSSYSLRGAETSSVWQVMVGRPLAEPGNFAWPQQIAVSPLWTAAICVLLWFVLNRHRFGEHVLFIGDSNAVSRVVGIDVGWEKTKLFMLMGTLASIAAVMLTLENKNFFGNQGAGYLLLAIAAVLIGGTSIFGGRATIVGTVFGCFVMIMLQPGLVAMGLTGSWVLTVQGLIFLVSIIFYLFVDEPQRRAAFFARFRMARPEGELGRPPSAG